MTRIPIPQQRRVFLPLNMREDILRRLGAREEDGAVFVGDTEVVFSARMVAIPEWGKARFGYTTAGRIFSRVTGWLYSQAAARTLFSLPEPPPVAAEGVA